MSIRAGKKDISKAAQILEGQWGSADEAAEELLRFAFDLYESKAKFTVAVQVQEPDNTGDKIALGSYGTETQARNAALSATLSSATKENALAYVLAVHHGTPASWYVTRKNEQRALTGPEVGYRERELARRIKWHEDNPNQPSPPEWGLHVPYQSETQPCEPCNGLGRIPIKRENDND